MTVASVASVKARLSSYVKASATRPVVVTRNGKAVAVLLGVRDDDELERLLLAHSSKLRSILASADQRIDEGAGIPHKEFWRAVAPTRRGTRTKHGSRQTKRLDLPAGRAVRG